MADEKVRAKRRRRRAKRTKDNYVPYAGLEKKVVQDFSKPGNYSFGKPYKKSNVKIIFP